MTSRMSEANQKPTGSPAGSQQLTSGQQTGQICHKLAICFSASGNLTIRTLDGVSTTLASIPIGFFVIDVQFDMVTWTGTATATGFYIA